MSNEELAVKLAETESRSKSNTHRIDALERDQEALNTIATSVAVMANEQKTISKKVEDIDVKVDALETKPAKRWDGLIDNIILVIAGAIVGFLLTKLGIQA
jgi:tetrahydromethanopterin S-methyltransferase subunit G